MTSPKKSIETKQVFVDFALAAARVLESPDCSAELAAAIMELSDALGEIIGPASPYGVTVALLRGLCLSNEATNGKAESNHAEIRAEPKTAPVGRFYARNSTQNQDSQALAKAATN